LFFFCGSRATADGNRLLSYHTTQTNKEGKPAAHNAILSACIGRRRIRPPLSGSGKQRLSNLPKSDSFHVRSDRPLTFRYDGRKTLETIVGDYRDWKLIRAWAEQVATDLMTVS
jgi:hypothetical protein